MKSVYHRKRGSILFISIFAIALGAMYAGSLLSYTFFSNGIAEKESGNVKCAQALKLSNNIYLQTIANTDGITNSEIQDLQKRIGGVNSPQQSIFGYDNSSNPSHIPGFRQITITFDQFDYVEATNLQNPTGGQAGFSFFPDVLTQNNVAVLSDNVAQDVPAFQEDSMATIGEQDVLRIIPVFNMLSFYDRDLEIFAEEQGGFFAGRLHCNGDLYLVNINKGVNTTMHFHGEWGAPILSTHGNAFRRGRGALAPRWWYTGRYGSGQNLSANQGLEFHTYSSSNFSNIMDTDFNAQNILAQEKSNLLRKLTPDFTNFEEHTTVCTDDTANEANARRYGGNGADFGYKFDGTSIATDLSAAERTFTVQDSNGDDYMVVSFDNENLRPPVTIQPYQYVEDTQYYDTPDTINYMSPIPSNYQEDAAEKNSIAKYGFNSIAALVIRDGVAYKRTTPGGSLTRVQGNFAYPDPSHPDAKVYSDLRWFGWFGMYDGVSPSPDNPARWHFPIKSVTLNNTQDANNAGSGSTSSEGTAVAFTFRSSTIHNPLNDGVDSGTASWIRTDIDLNDLSGYPPASTANATDVWGTNVGMFNTAYSTLNASSSTNGDERFDPVRKAYNVVKAEVRRLYNMSHLYTSRHNGVKMLNRGGSAPSDGTPPDVWGASVNAASFGGGVDYDGDGIVEFSSFWEDDSAIGHTTNLSTGYRYLRITFSKSAGTPIQIAEVNIKQGDTDYPNGSQTLTCSSNQGGMIVGNVQDDTAGTFWQPTTNSNEWIQIDMGAGNSITPDMLLLMTSDNGDPDSILLQGSDDAVTYTNLGQWTAPSWYTYSPTPDYHYQFFPVSRLYQYRRDPNNTTTRVLNGQLNLVDGTDSTPPIELMPIRHKSLCDTGVSPTQMDHWYVYNSTLPLSNRTLAMPSSRSNLLGWDLSTFHSDFSTDLLNAMHPLDYGSTSPSESTLNQRRVTNFGFPGLLTSNPITGLSPDPGCHNWLTLLYNAPEMLVRQEALSHETSFSYYAGDFGGYYGNDHLCMIDLQEKKINVFTEIDMAELTKECFQFNGIMDFTGNTNDIRDPSHLQNIIYVVNTTMGTNFFGKRVHCGAIRIKRGRLLTYPVSIASPNSIFVWGDFNCPGYWHHGPEQGGDVGQMSVSYTVPDAREHDSMTTYEDQPCALYCDAVQILENNWIPFDQTSSNDDVITKDYMGALYGGAGDSPATVNWNLGMTHGNLTGSAIWPPGTGNDFQATNNYLDFSNGTIFDHSLWWEDDGLRRTGGTGGYGMDNINLPDRASGAGGSRGCQLFTNYHELIFNVPNGPWYPHLTTNIFQRYGGGNPIMKMMPQCIVGGFFYGNVENKAPSFFWDVDVSGISVSRPSSVMLLDWLTSWIPRWQWIEFTRDQLMTLDGGSIKPSDVDGAYYDPPSDLAITNFYGFNANQYVENPFEVIKKRFGNVGFKLDVRSMHTYHWPCFSIWNSSGKQNYGRNFIGAYACLYDSRQATHEQREKDNSWEGRSFYVFNPKFKSQNGLPPGTPLTTQMGESTRTVGGTPWEY